MRLQSLPQHHAILLININRQEISSSLWGELGSAPSMHKYVNQAVLDIDTARELIVWAHTPYHEERVAIVSFHTATLPAQNAMLKILEEPGEKVRFILITSNKEHLLKTVISRTRLITPQDVSETNVFAKEFLETKPALRFKLKGVTALLAQEDEEGRKDREAVRSFIVSLVDVLATDKKIPKKYIKETLEMASYAGDPSVTVKFIIEYLSLLLPRCDTIS